MNDPEKNRWIQKRVYLVDEQIESSQMEDYIFKSCSIVEAISELKNSNYPVFLFQNRDDQILQAITHSSDEGYGLINLDG